MAEQRFEATLGGKAFAELADELVLVDIVEKEAQMDTQTVPIALREGMRRVWNARKSLSVELHFAIREQDIVRRAEVRDIVAAWAANGGALKVNYRPDRVLYVKNDTAPALGSSLNWTDQIVLTLTAYEVPYWQSAKVTSLQVYTQKLDSGEYRFANLLKPDGNAGLSRVECMLFHIGDDTLTRCKITCGKTVFDFDGMNLEPGAVIIISYDDGVLSVVNFADVDSEDNSLLRYRTADSSDDLLAEPNIDNQITISADQKLEGNLSARGIWR